MFKLSLLLLMILIRHILYFMFLILKRYRRL